jgi:hypothetical protein
MSLDTLFMLSVLPVLPFWLLMILLPNWAWTRRVVASPLIIAPAALLYALVGLPYLPEAFGALGAFSLPAITALFSTESAALVVWLHMIAVDLLAGRWAYLDSRARSINMILMAAILLAILCFAPLGLLIYLLVRHLRDSTQASNL